MKKRIFAALEISDDARRKVAAHINFLRERFPEFRVGWEKTEKLHLTLKFLGEINDEQSAKLLEAAERTARQISSFKMQIAGTGVFPSPRQARILWLGVKSEGESLRKLNEILESECEEQGFAKEKRLFKAHLTIGRLKEKSGELVEAHLGQNFEPVEFEASEIVVFQSTLQPTGSVYSVVSRYNFKENLTTNERR
jgi:2'-5' RNA ligase